MHYCMSLSVHCCRIISAYYPSSHPLPLPLPSPLPPPPNYQHWYVEFELWVSSPAAAESCEKPEGVGKHSSWSEVALASALVLD